MRPRAPGDRRPGGQEWRVRGPARTELGGDMVTEIVRAGLVQHSWTGDKDSMISKAVGAIGVAASAGAQVVCLQELFYGPYFCQVQDSDYYSYTELIPDGPTTQLMREVARRHGVVLIVPMFEEELPGLYYNTAAVIDADGSYLGKYRKTHIPQVKGFWEKFFFKPGASDWPVFKTKYVKLGVYICYDRHFPEGWRALALAGADYIFYPTAIGWSAAQDLPTNEEQYNAWQTIQRSHAVANGVHVVS